MKKEVKIMVIKKSEELNESLKNNVAEFLYKHLDQFGDPIDDITKSIDYAMELRKSFGGSIIIAQEEEEIVGAVILNRTGMDGYIPENILVYIAVHRQRRGQGLGRILMNKAKEVTEGSIALHVEEDNPAKFLYEKVGFEKKYAEMRYIR